jgi:hypothetical protein
VWCAADADQVYDATLHVWCTTEADHSFYGPYGPYACLKTLSVAASETPFKSQPDTTGALNRRFGATVLPGINYMFARMSAVMDALHQLASVASQYLGGSQAMTEYMASLLPTLGPMSDLRPRCAQFRTGAPFCQAGFDPNPSGTTVQQQAAVVTADAATEFADMKFLAVSLSDFLGAYVSAEYVRQHVGNLGEPIQVKNSDGRPVLTWPQTKGAFFPSDQLVSVGPGTVVRKRTPRNTKGKNGNKNDPQWSDEED